MTDHTWEPCTNGSLGKMRWFLMRCVNGKPEYLFDVRHRLRRWYTVMSAQAVADLLNGEGNHENHQTNVG